MDPCSHRSATGNWAARGAAWLAFCLVLPQTPLAAPPNQIGNAGTSTTVQLPTFGIAIDAAGVVTWKAFAEAERGPVAVERIAAARAALPADIAPFSPRRVVSLPRLERALQAILAEGKKPPETMLQVAGLQRVEYVFCYPEQHELLLVGPAEGWLADPAGRKIGLTTGQPTLELADLAVALRAFPAGKKSKTFLGCTIDPRADGLARLQQFQQTIPSSVSQNERGQVQQFVAQGVRQALGMAQIRVFGVKTETHFAHVLVEADYRMKCIGIGLEPPAVRLASFLDLSRTGAHGTLERWWFTPDYKCLRMTADELGVQLVGQGVQLQTEHKVIGPGGKLFDTGAPSKPSELFTAGFTAKYPQLAQRSPVFAQLRQLIDLAVAAAFIQHKDLYGRAAWKPEILTDEARLPVEKGQPLKEVPAVVNAVWRSNRLLAPAGGGVSIHPALALEADALFPDEGEQVSQQRVALALPENPAVWWWNAGK